MTRYDEVLAAMTPEQRAAHKAREKALRAAEARRERQLRALRSTITIREQRIVMQYRARCAKAERAYRDAEAAAFAEK